jgi:hypothetical protein
MDMKENCRPLLINNSLDYNKEVKQVTKLRYFWVILAVAIELFR